MIAFRRAAVIVMTAVMLVGCSRESATPEKKAEPVAAAANPEMAKKLAGKWVRPDGGYVLDIRSVGADGKLDAGYFNPNPINVASAAWRVSDQGLLIVAVELRDVNYPGAKYTLRFDAAGDKLAGAYYQPISDATYDIEFERLKE